MSLRVGIYNRWLATLGGGEKHSLAVAECLSDKHKVNVITHKPVSRQLAEERLGLDLSRVEFVTIPDIAASEIALITSGYDFFINSSYMDFMPSFAQYSATLVWFPAKVDQKKSLARQLKLSMRRWLKMPAVLTGIQSFYVEGGVFKWATDTVLKIRLPYNTSPYTCSFRLSALDKKVKSAIVELDQNPSGRVTFTNIRQPVPFEINIPGSKDKSHHELSINVEGIHQPDGISKMELSQLDLSLPHFRLYKSLFERRLVGVAIRLQYYPPGASMLDYLDTYDRIWANSEFTRRWIKSYWKRDSDVLYPLVNVEDFKPEEKRNQILNVGRFFAGQHNKKHLELIQAFKQMADNGLTGWELHMVGGVAPGDEHRAYLESVYQASRGYPIFIHNDIRLSELVDLYAHSAIYWHASGYGEDERKDPVKFEHFGITTVEAMASRCVPVVIGKGGQPEIVRHAINGYLWQTLDELKTLTDRLIEEPILREQMAAVAQADSRKYDKEHFQARLEQLLAKIGLPLV
jgi:glycosyltransferase involved in cell wall biosynthesis